MNKLFRRIVLLILVVLSLGLLSFTTYKAASMSFTHDESITVSRYPSRSFMKIISYAPPNSGANNHIINTLLIKASSTFFKPGDFTYRLPNVLAHLVYLVFSILLVRKIKNPILAIVGFILINFNPYFLDFFSMARGYGLSYAFSIISLYYLICYVEKPKIKYEIVSLIASALAVLSQFVMIHFFLTLIIILNIFFINNISKEQISIRKKIKSLVLKNRVTISVIVILAIILFEPIRRLTKGNELYGHGLRGFWKDTIVSFFHMSLYDQKYLPYFAEKLGLIFLILISIASIISVTVFIKQKSIIKHSYLQIFPMFLVIAGLIPVIQHYILGSQYLDIRLTLWYVPLLGFTVLYLLESLVKIKRLRVAGIILSAFIGFIFIYHTVNSSNKYSALEWKYDSSTKEMLSDLEKLNDKQGNDKINLGITWLFEPTVNHYRELKEIEWLEKATRKGIEGKYDYYYIHKSDRLYQSTIDSLEIIKEYKRSKSVLAKPKN